MGVVLPGGEGRALRRRRLSAKMGAGRRFDQPGGLAMTSGKPLLHLVFGGVVSDPRGTEFVDPQRLDVIGIFPN